MKKSGDYILWLPSWYPNKLEPLAGDFIQRHARSVALFEPVKVIFVIRDEWGKITRSYYKETFENNGVQETIIYYFIPPQKIKAWEKWISFRTYCSVYKKAVAEAISVHGKPKLAHVYIAMKAGIIGRWIKKTFSIPYVITEQWTIYLQEAKPNFQEFPFYFKHLFKKIFKGAENVSVVSDYLGKRLQQLFPVKSMQLIPNVVDTTIFKPAKSAKAGSTKRFLHISLLGYQKNPEHIVKAFFLFHRHYPDFVLNIVGPQKEELVKMVEELHLTAHVTFHPEVPQQQLVKLVQEADALILYSRYETFGCVLIEAHACGVPVIVSDIPVLHENVKEPFNGLFAAGENPEALAERLEAFIRMQEQFDADTIADHARRNFNYHKVGRQFGEWYRRVLR